MPKKVSLYFKIRKRQALCQLLYSSEKSELTITKSLGTVLHRQKILMFTSFNLSFLVTECRKNLLKYIAKEVLR